MSGILMMSVGNSYGYKPVNTVAPAVTGTATVGQTLSCSTGTWNAAPPSITYTYQWQRGTTNISGATSSTYVIQSADAGNTLRCVVTATNAVGATSANSNSTATVAQAPVNTAAPTLSGTTQVGNTLSSTTGSWTATPAVSSYSYQWQRNGSNIGGATSSTYTLVPADDGKNIRCVVTATNTAGSTQAASAATSAIASLAIGAAYGGGYFAGKISTSANGVATHYLIVAPKATGQSDDGGIQWKTTNTASGVYSRINGNTNSSAINNASHPAAQFCEGLSIGGFTDWYLPSELELQVCYYFLKPTLASTNNTSFGANPYAVSPQPINTNYTDTNPSLTSVTEFQAYNSESFRPDRIFWTSTEASDNAGVYCCSFSDGRVGPGYGPFGRTNYFIARAVRRIAM